MLVSLNSILICLETLPFLTRVHTQFGVLVIVVEQMILDVILCILRRADSNPNMTLDVTLCTRLLRGFEYRTQI